MTNILYTYFIQIQNKAAFFLINIDTFIYNWDRVTNWE